MSPPLGTAPTGTVVLSGPGAEGVAVDPSTGVVAVGGGQGATLFDESGHVLASVDLPGRPRHVGLVAPGGPFIVPVQDAQEVALVNQPSGKVNSTVHVGLTPHDMTVVGHRIFVGNEQSNTVTEIRKGKAIATIPVVTQPGGLATVGSDVAVVGVRSRRLELFGAVSLREIASVPVETGPSHVAAFGHYLYVVDTGGTSVRVFDIVPRLHLVGSVRVPASPLGMAVDSRSAHLWITCTASNRLVELSLTDRIPKIVASVPTVRQPNSVAVDPATDDLFVVGAQAGVLEIIHQ